MSYWATLDHLIQTHQIVIDRPKGSKHPKFPDLIYPFDYGYLEGTSGGDGNGIDVCLGSMPERELVAILCTVDTQKFDAEVKLLIGCTNYEMNFIERFFNYDFRGAGLLVTRDKSG